MTATTTTRLQILVDKKDRQLGEKIAQNQYGLNLNQVLRLVIKKIINGEFSIGVFSNKTEQVSTQVEKEILKSYKSGVVTLADKKPLTHYSINETMDYLESDEQAS
jgi:hypothetical protein